jgi:hypothetical protein
MRMVSLSQLDPAQFGQLEQLTFAAARDHSPGWLPTSTDAREEIMDALGRSRA